MRPAEIGQSGEWMVVDATGAQRWWPRRLAHPHALVLQFSTREAACQWIARQEAKR